MSRGNQREVDRARAQKRAAAGQKKGKKKDDGNASQALTNKKESYVPFSHSLVCLPLSTACKSEAILTICS